MYKILVFYHYFYPDDVVSAVLMTNFCEELKDRGWEVEAMPCNRGCWDDARAYARLEHWKGIRIRRVFRPRFRQASSIGRLLNAAWLIGAWSLRAFRGKKRRPDVVLMGTDPPLSVLVALSWKLIRRRVRVVHWCYDLYPEAAVADGILRAQSLFTRFAGALARRAYGACDLIADLGPCMRSRLDQHNRKTPKVTLTPWALTEPPAPCPVDAGERERIFGDARLGVLYSGNYGRAHSCEAVLELARLLRGDGIRFAFGVRGNSVEQLKGSITGEDSNVRMLPFAPEAELLSRLCGAEIHCATLRHEWTGTVVPSKFFGSLAVGRPVLFSGSRESALAKWIEEHGVGWVLDRDSLPHVAEELRALAGSQNALIRLHGHCHSVYQEHFSRKRVMDRWDAALRGLLEKPGN